MSFTWTEHKDEEAGLIMPESVSGKNCTIYLEQRPHYCDRGNWVAKLFVNAGAHPIKLFIDEADGWPRYYFDYDRAKLEIQAWLTKRKEELP